MGLDLLIMARALVSFEARLMGVMFYPAGAQVDLNFLPVSFRRERSNIYSSKSVLVTTKKGDSLGHIDRHTAEAVAEIMDTYDNVLQFYWLVKLARCVCVCVCV